MVESAVSAQTSSRGSPPENYRNGYTKKTVKTQPGEVDIKVPRDRNRLAEPKTLTRKYDRNADGMEEAIPASAVRLRHEPAGYR
ncbi:MAG: transposase [Dysosmobacter sp.]